MATQRFTEQMRVYSQWRTDLLKGINYYQRWLNARNMSNTEDDLRIYEILESLKADKLIIAFVAEFARGKTELINAIFFSEYDRRLLPSEAGRTTMCPTELFFDTESELAYIRLLPIETRLTDTRIAEYKADPIHWTNIGLELGDPDSMVEAFKETVKTKRVPVDEARKLGLFSDTDTHLLTAEGKVPDTIEVPLWRHALISFPHPLLKQGLVILDTPGLNAVGSEPELTLNMLPNAHAVIFIMAADTGVTKSDLEMWTTNVKPLDQANERGIIAVLNKVDTLWDDLKSVEQIENAIAEQSRKAAKTLGIDPANVIPASAQKGLLAKIRHDEEMLTRSNIQKLENILGADILTRKLQLLSNHVKTEVGSLIQETHDQLTVQIAATTKQHQQLSGLSGKSAQMIEQLIQKTRTEQVAYYKNLESFQASKAVLSRKSAQLADMLNISEFDRLVTNIREKMTGSWTTHGLKGAMKNFFDNVDQMLLKVDDYAGQLNIDIVSIYKKFSHVQQGAMGIKPVYFTTDKYVAKFKRLKDEAEHFRESPVTVMTEQSFLIKKFFITLVSHARDIYAAANQDAEKWSKAVLTPLVKQIKLHKDQMEKELENLRKVNESRDTLASKLEEISKTLATQKKRHKEITAILALVNRPMGGDRAVATEGTVKETA